MYTNQTLCVRWGHALSNLFSVKNGVKQGGVLSPILFAIYTDGLLKRLQETGVGCHMGHRFGGALAYADDITLLSPSRSCMAILVKVCEKYAAFLIVKRVNYCILQVDIVVQSIKELKLTDSM